MLGDLRSRFPLVLRPLSGTTLRPSAIRKPEVSIGVPVIGTFVKFGKIECKLRRSPDCPALALELVG